MCGWLPQTLRRCAASLGGPSGQVGPGSIHPTQTVCVCEVQKIPKSSRAERRALTTVRCQVWDRGVHTSYVYAMSSHKTRAGLTIYLQIGKLIRMDIKLPVLACKRCGHQWTPRESPVVRCARCKSRYLGNQAHHPTGAPTGAHTQKENEMSQRGIDNVVTQARLMRVRP